MSSPLLYSPTLLHFSLLLHTLYVLLTSHARKAPSCRSCTLAIKSSPLLCTPTLLHFSLLLHTLYVLLTSHARKAPSRRSCTLAMLDCHSWLTNTACAGHSTQQQLRTQDPSITAVTVAVYFGAHTAQSLQRSTCEFEQPHSGAWGLPRMGFGQKASSHARKSGAQAYTNKRAYDRALRQVHARTKKHFAGGRLPQNHYFRTQLFFDRSNEVHGSSTSNHSHPYTTTHTYKCTHKHMYNKNVTKCRSTLAA